MAKILVIDDERAIRNILKETLEFEGYSVDVAENGIEWLQLSDFVSKKESTVAESFRIKWIPSMYLVGPDGKILLGTVMISKLTSMLETL